MKRSILLVLMAAATLLVQAQSVQTSSGAYGCSLRKSSLPFTPALPGAEMSVPGHSFDVLKYTLDLDIYDCFLAPYPHSFTGTEII